MKKKITRHLHTFYKKLHKQNYAVLAVFIILFVSVSIFFITRGTVPHSSELAYIEHSILGKDAGSVVPASCESSPWVANGDGNYTGCGTQVCWDGSTITPAMGQVCSTPANCTGTPWGTVAHGASVTGYSASVVDSPTTCASVSQARSCWNGSLSGSYTITSCIEKSGSITVPASCVIAPGSSTCTVTASWVSANLTTPRFYDANTDTTLSGAANGSQLVWVAWGGTTFKLTDSTLYEYDTRTVTVSCAAGTTWNPTTGPGGTGQCEYDAIATLSASPTRISYGTSTSVLTSSSTYATNCDINGNPPWPYNPGILRATTNTGPLTSTTTYTFQCTGLGSPSPVVSATVITGSAQNPILNKDDITFQAAPTFTVAFTGQYTPNGKFVVTGTNTDSCTVTRDGTTLATGASPLTVVFSDSGSQAGTYRAMCEYTDGNGVKFMANNGIPYLINYQPVPPPPVVSLRASPTTISAGSPAILSWTVTYPGSVQGDGRVCKLKATPVCTGGSCNADQLAASTTINNIIQTQNTDANDPAGTRKITSTALNIIVPTYST
ncbi:MAG: hypothetical protein K9L31_03465, partial [Candidatus Pacebacteria bacterium]|nr:hypothetical protein [Candidatus Paceibacterota bacterium]